jgi:hypothetical protein
MSPDNQFWWNWWVNFAVAFATVAAVLVALYGEQWRANLFPPLLQLRLLGSAGERTELRRANGDVDDVRYNYVQVSNARRGSIVPSRFKRSLPASKKRGRVVR